MLTFFFTRTLCMLARAYLDFATHKTCTHTCKHKKHKHTHAHTHARKFPSPALPSVLKVRFAAEINRAIKRPKLH